MTDFKIKIKIKIKEADVVTSQDLLENLSDVDIAHVWKADIPYKTETPEET